MGIGRKFNKNNMTRPSKSGREKARRQKEQSKRLIALGVDEAKVAKMTVKEIRDMLKRPAKIGK